MPALKPDQLESSVRSGKLGSLYLFDGPENWWKERVLNQIIAKLVPVESKDFNLDRLDGRSCTGADIVNAAQGLPFLGDRRVVVVSATEELSAADSRLVGETLAQLPESTCLIFLHDGKANLRDEIPAKVNSHGAAVTFWTPFANQLPAWVTSEAKVRGKTISYDAAQMLAESCQDLQQIANELDKLSLFVGQKKTIDATDIRQHGLPDEVGDTKALEEALWAKDTATALEQGRLLADVGVRGEMIFPICERVFRTLLLAHTYHSVKKMGFDDICSALNMRFKTAQTNLMKGMKAYKPAEIKTSLEKILQADYDLKTGTLPSDVDVSLLLLNLCGEPLLRR